MFLVIYGSKLTCCLLVVIKFRSEGVFVLVYGTKPHVITSSGPFHFVYRKVAFGAGITRFTFLFQP